MNFSGWVAIPRSILNNTHTQRLTITEQLVLMTLFLLANSKTGSGHINAAVLLSYLPELKYNTAKRVLLSLEVKRFVYRQIVHASKNVYGYWLHGYQISEGKNRLRWTNLSQVFVSRDIKDIQYDEVAPDVVLDVVPDVVPDMVPDHVLNNNKDHEHEHDTDNPSGSKECEFGVTKNVSANVTNSVSHFVTGRDFQVSENVTENVMADEPACSLPSGYELRDGYGGTGVYGPNGLKLSPTAIANMLRTQ